jgi:DHA2 family methylenomycin A resistance protein-like MFS transporter
MTVSLGTPEFRVTSDQPHARTVLAVASAGFFLITLDISIINVALAQIQSELGGGTTGQQWVIDGYTLLFAALLLFAGNLADRISAQKSYLLGATVFGAASVGCTAAPDIVTLVMARAVQGVGAAIMLPASMALVREAFPDPRRRARALGVWAVGGAVAGLVGQPLGGLLATLDWRWVFGINIPVCGAMALLLFTVPAAAGRPTRFDWPGQALAVTTLVSLVYGLIEGGHSGFGEPTVVGALAVTVLALTGFIAVQATSRQPMMPLDLFRSHGLQRALPVGFAFMVGQYGNVFVVSLHLQQQLGLSPLRAGFVFLPAAAFAVIGNLISGILVNRFGPRLPVVGGLLSMVVGLLALSLTVNLGSPIVTALCLIPIAIGGSIAMPSITAVVLDGVSVERAGTASAVFNTFRQVGGAVAIAVFGALIARPDAFIAGYQTSMGIAAALLLLAALNSVRIQDAP